MEPRKPSSIGIVISTYNHPAWLEKTLWGYACQSRLPDEILIADDGSREDTPRLIEAFARESGLNLRHIWHEDDGFRKCRILNKAIEASRSEYLIFTDHDCIPRRDFVETHYRFAEPGYMLSGGYFKLPMDISLAITEDDIRSGRAFELGWLRSQGLKLSFKCSKLSAGPRGAALMNAITPARASWNGCNSSTWRETLVAANGFDERMKYGGLDRELGERLVNMGIRSKQIRYSAICLHLDHNRPYKDLELINANLAIRRQTRRNKVLRTPYGIEP